MSLTKFIDKIKCKLFFCFKSKCSLNADLEEESLEELK